ncbi:DNA polymerase/3'-5' exonuclease PolX [Geotalea uraniireducens]|uniref:DNA polymerase beta n=1 Tax=Geotalea uraniireducens TaxID=351604 RepID=A0ABM8EN10_9BACT|nr:DNA polymerase/3'-5' exonuclease PolX [Geotalea uraniireducens]BDV43588.1 DNA polymerase/3'-5' exonuclease PolX [Geotalea uraniireducens]
MKNFELARIFTEMGDILEIKGDNPFKIRAYRRAALNLEGLAQSVETLSDAELREIPGIGEELAAKIEEYCATGSVHAHEKLQEALPPGLLDILAIPGLGPKTVKLLYDQAGVTDLDGLERAANDGKLLGIPGIRAKTVENILKGIATVRRGRERRPLGLVLPLARELMAALQKQAPIERLELAGSIRRRRETVKDIDLVATTAEPERLMEAFVRLPLVTDVVMHGPTRSSVTIRDGINVDLRVVAGESFGAALAYLTGSKGHNIRLRDLAVRRGLKINEYGIFREPGGERLGGAAEEDVYRLLELPFVPPELREDGGEVEAALAGQLPQLVTTADIRGELHAHSRWSDGAHSLDELVAAARARGLSYLALTDHSRGLGVANGLTPERLREQRQEVAALNGRLTGFTILHGTEMDIRGDGSLDFPDEVLAELDLVIASIHSGFRQSREQLTGRVCAAMRNPYVDIIAHPTGRLLDERDPYEIDLAEVVRVARETGTALEINAYPLRLDLADVWARRAKDAGVMLAINTDVHVLSQFETLDYGVAVARRGWLEKGDILNCLDLAALRAWLAAKRRQAKG